MVQLTDFRLVVRHCRSSHYIYLEGKKNSTRNPEHSTGIMCHTNFFQRAWNIQKMKINAVRCLAFHPGVAKFVHSTLRYFFIIWKQNENIIASKAIKHDFQLNTHFHSFGPLRFHRSFHHLVSLILLNRLSTWASFKLTVFTTIHFSEWIKKNTRQQCQNRFERNKRKYIAKQLIRLWFSTKTKTIFNNLFHLCGF